MDAEDQGTIRPERPRHACGPRVSGLTTSAGLASLGTHRALSGWAVSTKPQDDRGLLRNDRTAIIAPALCYMLVQLRGAMGQVETSDALRGQAQNLQASL